MSYQVGVVFNKEKNDYETIYEGYSFTCLIFGPFWFLYKRMPKMALLCFLLDIFTGGLIPRIILGFFANDMHKNSLLSQGYQGVNNQNNNDMNYEKIKTKNLSRKDSKMNESILNKIINLKNEIIARIDKSEQLDNSFILDLRSMLDNYIEQTKLLIEREAKLALILENYSLKDINSSIEELKVKNNTTENLKLKDEYNKLINMYENQKKSFNEVYEQRELVRLKLDSVLMNLDQIKFDLVKIENIVNQEEMEFILKSFHERTNSLSSYVSNLKQSYDNLNSLNLNREL